MRVNGEFVGIGGNCEYSVAPRTNVHTDPTFDTVVALIEAETAEPKVYPRLVPAAEINAMIAASRTA